MNLPKNYDWLDLFYIVIAVLMLFYIYVSHQTIKFERAKYDVLMSWIKNNPGKSPLMYPADEKEFSEYIVERAKLKLKEQGGSYVVKPVFGIGKQTSRG